MDPSIKAEDSVPSVSGTAHSFASVSDEIQGVAIFILDAEGRILTWNRAAEQMYGYPTHAIYGESVERLQSPPDEAAARTRQALTTAAKEGHFGAELNQLRKDGSTFWAVVTIARFQSETEKSPPQFAVLVRDVTVRKKVEKDLQRERALSESLLESLPGTVVVIGSDGRLKRWNKLTEITIGFPPERFRDALATDFVPPEERQYIGDRIALVLREGKADTEGHILTADGRRIPYLFTGIRLDLEGSPCCVFVGMDISQQKQAEAALRESEERFRRMANTVPVVVWMSDARGGITFVNDRWTEITGQLPRDVHGDGWVQALHPDDRVRAYRTFIDAVERRTPSSLEYRLRSTGGEYRWMFDIGQPRFGANGQFEGHIGVVLDTTEHRKLEDQLRHAQKMEAVGQLAGGVAHDFNNLLTVITGYTEVLLSTMQPTEPAYPALKAIREAGERAASLTQQLLAFSRKAMLAPRVMDPNGIVRDSEKLIRRLMGEDVQIELALAESIPQVRVDPAQLMQVLLNLASNSRDAMPRGGSLTIRTSVAVVSPEEAARAEIRAGEYVTIAVRDTGHGMSPDVMRHLFEPFFTTKGVGKGTGLGLAVVHGFIQECQGKIDVVSQPGQGAEFRLFLPVVSDAEEHSPEHAAAKGGETVLLVEDEQGVRDLAQFILQTHGYRVLTAGNGADALKIAATAAGRIDLLITDVVMPELSGDAVAAAVRERYPGIKILFVSGYTQDAVLLHGIEQQKVAFLQKPFTPHMLAKKVRQTLDRP